MTNILVYYESVYTRFHVALWSCRERFACQISSQSPITHFLQGPKPVHRRYMCSPLQYAACFKLHIHTRRLIGLYLVRVNWFLVFPFTMYNVVRLCSWYIAHMCIYIVVVTSEQYTLITNNGCALYWSPGYWAQSPIKLDTQLSVKCESAVRSSVSPHRSCFLGTFVDTQMSR